MINSIKQNSVKNFKLLLPHTNKALAIALKESPQVEMQRLLSPTKDLSSLLSSLLKESATATQSQNSALLKLIEENPTLKSLTNTTPPIKTLLKLLKKEKVSPQLQKKLHHLLTNIKEITPQELHKRFQTTGVLLENHLKKGGNQKELLSNDLKSLLLKTTHELSDGAKFQEIHKQIEKLSLAIEYQQLTSILSNGTSFFIPYAWDRVQEGEISIKQINEERSLCDIHLQLQEYGKINLRLALFTKNQLSLSVELESKELKSIIQKNIKFLKKKLFHEGITLQKIYFIKEKENAYDIQSSTELNIGFEIKI